jgi:outer membrane biosynthesis protein TonB
MLLQKTYGDEFTGIGAENKGAAWVNGLRDYDALLARMNQMSQNAQAKKPAEDLSSSSSESDSEEEKKDKKKKKSSKKDKESKKSKKSSKKGKKQSSTSSSDEEDEAKKDTEVEVPVENKRVIPRHFMFVMPYWQTTRPFSWLTASRCCVYGHAAPTES